MTRTQTAAPLPVAPVFVQLTMEEYIVASLSDTRAFILHNDTTGEAIVIEPISHKFESLPKP